jgi:hypothetical protein
MRVFKYIIIIPLLLSATTMSWCQSYPVRVSTRLVPPYSLKLSDYSSGITDRIAFTVSADVSRPDLQVKFKLTIEGQNVTISTNPAFNPPPFNLRGGIPEYLAGWNLVDYFNPNNLIFQGMTRQQFERTGTLPEGLYRFQLEVLEYNRGVKISNTGIANAWLILNDPPVINLPQQNEKLKARMPQNVVLQWTPRHTGSPNAAFSTEYDIKMVEIWPATRNPNDAILSSPPIFEATTSNTTFVYGPEQTQLEPGRRYAFQVRARSISGVEELDLFKNNGKSEVFTFIYGDACDLPTGVKAKATGSYRVAVGWEGLFNHTAYKVRYREAGKANANWYESNLVLTETEIVSLKPNTSYEYQVAGVCGPFDGPYTTVATVTTPDTPPVAYSCGLPASPLTIDPSNLVASLKPGDLIEAGDFTVTLTRVSGSDGTFSGEGVLEVPYLKNAKVAASFSNIMVSTQLRMVSGHMNVTGAALDIIPDEITAKLGELNETLDELDALLNSAEDVLDDIDAVLDLTQQVLNEVMAYLPDDIVQEINTAKAEISTAKAHISAATSDEEKAEAKAEVKAGRDKLKTAAGNALEYYADAIQRFANIVWLVLQDIKQEVTGNQNTDQGAQDYVQEIYENQGVDASAQGTEDGNLVYIGSLKEDGSGTPAQPQLQAFYDRVQSFMEQERNRMYIKLLAAVVLYYASEDAVQQSFRNDIRIDGEALVREILTRMKNGQTDEQIKTYVEDYLKTSVLDMADYIITNSIAIEE